MMKTVYKDFVNKAATGRDKSFDDIDEIAQGVSGQASRRKHSDSLMNSEGLILRYLSLKSRQVLPLMTKLTYRLTEAETLLEELMERMVEDMEGSISYRSN